MSVIWKNKKGKEITLLNPSEKGRKCADELRAGVHATAKMLNMSRLS